LTILPIIALMDKLVAAQARFRITGYLLGVTALSTPLVENVRNINPPHYCYIYYSGYTIRLVVKKIVRWNPIELMQDQ
jgi:hypothetical protein